MSSRDIASGIKNALERGENLEQAKQSFLNAGYKKEEVEAASREIYGQRQEVPWQENHESEWNRKTSFDFNEAPEPEKINNGENHENTRHDEGDSPKKNLLLIFIIISVLVLTGALILGLFWDKIINALS